MMWSDLLVALGLVLVFEGILPFLNPRKLRSLTEMIENFTDRQLRIAGFAAMAAGVALIYLSRLL